MNVNNTQQFWFWGIKLLLLHILFSKGWSILTRLMYGMSKWYVSGHNLYAEKACTLGKCTSHRKQYICAWCPYQDYKHIATWNSEMSYNLTDHLQPLRGGARKVDEKSPERGWLITIILRSSTANLTKLTKCYEISANICVIKSSTLTPKVWMGQIEHDENNLLEKDIFSVQWCVFTNIGTLFKPIN